MTAVDLQDFTFIRTLDAPRALVWKAWSEAAALAQWWGPKNAKIRVISLDFRPGGMFHYAMAFQPGREMYGRFIYREVVAPERLVFVNSFSDANCGITRAPFPELKGKWPLEVLHVMRLTELGGTTTLTLRASPINATVEEQDIFVGNFQSMRQGYGGTFEQLAGYLAK